MSAFHEFSGAPALHCLNCRGHLVFDRSSLRCAGCSRLYPVIDGIPILVDEPVEYLRSELAMLTRTSGDAERRRDMLDKNALDGALSDEAIDRSKDVIAAERARVATYLALLAPAAKLLESFPDGSPLSQGRRRAGWAVDSLLPYLLRDWTGTAELEAASSTIGAALAQAVPDPSGLTIVFSGCGAGGLLPKIAPGFERVIGFDLTLPVLAAARQLLNGKNIELALPRAINACGRVSLHMDDPVAIGKRCELFAMDAFDTAFADGSIDCVVTSFLIDLVPDPRKLAMEIHRILSPDGIWINYGPSGPLTAIWRFDQREGAAFFEDAGFTVARTDACRATYLDLSRDFPNWSFQNHMCYLISARKSGRPKENVKAATPRSGDPSQVIPRHFPGATVIKREGLGEGQKSTINLRFERPPGVVENVEISSRSAQLFALVDGKKNLLEIADLLKRAHSVPVEETLRAFGRYFDTGLLTWQGR